MNKLRIIAALIKYLYIDKTGDTNLTHTVNRVPDGTSWFQVEPSYVWINTIENGVATDLNGNQYAVVGGGKEQGKLVHIGHQFEQRSLFSSDDREPSLG